jgi:hypothetical protein
MSKESKAVSQYAQYLKDVKAGKVGAVGSAQTVRLSERLAATRGLRLGAAIARHAARNPLVTGIIKGAAKGTAKAGMGPMGAVMTAGEVGLIAYHGAKALHAGREYGKLKKKVKARIQQGYTPQAAPASLRKK